MKYLKLIIPFLFINMGVAQAKPIIESNALNKVLAAYLEIKNALVADNSKAANEAALHFTGAIKTISTTGMDEKQKSTWTKYAEKLRYDGEHIGESKAISHQREHFGSLSSNLYAVLKVFRSNDAVLYQQYCPMEKKSWLSESSIIKNPYLGAKMPGCGRTIETLKSLNK